MASKPVGLQLFMTTILFSLTSSVKGQEATVTGTVGEHADLPCDVNEKSCGLVYFITWTKNVSNEWKRLYLYSDAVEKPLQELANPSRAQFFLKESTAHLRISPLKLEDEGSYKCDVTYVRGKCPSLSYAHLVMHARPNPPTMLHIGRVYRNKSSAGPFGEGETVTFHCTTTGGRPAPRITWWKDDENLPEESTATSEGEAGISNVTSTVKLQLKREDLGSRLECRVENEATETPLVTWVKLELNVKPYSLEMEEQPIPVIEGEHVDLSCTVHGAKPAASVTWYNGTNLIAQDASTQKEVMKDGTSRTTSHLVLPLTRYDHQKTIRCEATNSLMIEAGESPLEDSVKLQVWYSPSVVMGPSKITANETGAAIINCTYDANPRNLTEITWYRDGMEVNSSTDSRYRFNNVIMPIFTINFLSRNDAGMYSCSVNNSVGRSKSVNSAYVDVMYPPIVTMKMSPTSVAEDESSIVRMSCHITDGNPQNLQRVRWYKNSTLINEVNDKDIRWVNLTREVSGYYSCRGKNEAGWGNISEAVYFTVHFRPGAADLIHFDEPAIKGKPTTLGCIVDDLGSPMATTFHWEHNGETIPVTTANYTIDQVRLNSRGNYSCAARNHLGIGKPGYFVLKPKAAPHVIQHLPPEYGALQNDSSISISCRVECDPLCDIQWWRNGEDLASSDMYDIKSTRHPEEFDKNIFESVVSTLIWNLTAWPGGMLDRDVDNAHYTCSSTGNAVGPGDNTTAFFRVQFPPENITLSSYNLNVVEGHIQAKVHCSAHSWPQSNYIWKYRDTVIADTATLVLNYSIPRGNSGVYSCRAENRHGFLTADLFINVLYRPDCILSERLDGGRPTFTCEAVANPEAVTFFWYRQNETLHEHIVTRGSTSILTLPTGTPEYDGDYYCRVNNSVGESEVCHVQRQTTLPPAGWIPELTDENMILIAGVASAIVIVSIIVVVVIALVVRNRRIHTGSKPNLEKRENPEGRVQPPETTPLNKSGHHANRSPAKPSDMNNPSKAKPGGSKPVYQNVTTGGKKDHPTGNAAKYENMAFHHQKDPRRPKTPIPTVRMRTTLPASHPHVYQNVARLKHTRQLSNGTTVASLSGSQPDLENHGKTPSSQQVAEETVPSPKSQHGDECQTITASTESNPLHLTDKENNIIKVEQTQTKVKNKPEGVVYADLMLPNHGRSLVGRKGSCTEYATLKFEKEENGTPESFQSRRQ